MEQTKLKLEDFGIQKTNDGYKTAAISPSIKSSDIGDAAGANVTGYVIGVLQPVFEDGKALQLRLNIPDFQDREDGDTRLLTLNKTNIMTMLNAYSQNIEKWENKMISIVLVDTQYKGKNLLGMRIKPLD